MHDYLFLIPIAIALLIGVISPGPSFLMVAQTALQKNRSHSIIMSIGMGTGAVTFALLASYGLALVLKTVPWLYGILKIAGALYLCYLAVLIWKNADKPIDQSAQLENRSSYTKSYFIGLLTQLSNPKTAIVISGIMMAFLPAQLPEYSHLFIAVIAFVIDAGWYCLVAIALTTKPAQRVYLKYSGRINRIASAFLGFIGVRLSIIDLTPET